MKKIKSIDEALLCFAENASQHAKATEAGDSKKGNRCFAAMSRSLVFLHDNNAVLQLLPYLHSEDIGIRGGAAFALLSFKEDICRQVLEEIRDGNNGILSLTAEYTLREWNNRKLTFPWEWNKDKTVWKY